MPIKELVSKIEELKNVVNILVQASAREYHYTLEQCILDGKIALRSNKFSEVFDLF